MTHGLFSFETEISFDLAGRCNIDFLFLRPEGFLPGLDHVIARRHISYLESAIRPGHGEIRMLHDADVRAHPAMDIAFDPNHHFGLDEPASNGRLSGSLAMVPFAIDLSERVDIVSHRIGVRDLQRLARLYAQHPRMKPATALIQGDRSCGYFEGLSFQSLLDVYEHVSEGAIRVHHDRLVISFTGMRLDTSWIPAHIDRLPGGLPSRKSDGPLKHPCRTRI